MEGGNCGEGFSSGMAGRSGGSKQAGMCSGCGTLDELFGALLPYGTILLVDECFSRKYANVVARCFLAQGAYEGERLFVASTRRSSRILSRLPQKRRRTDSGDAQLPSVGTPSEDLKIAWRYSTVPKVNSSLGGANRSERTFDMSRFIEKEIIASCDVECFPSEVEVDASPPSYSSLWRALFRSIRRGGNSNLDTVTSATSGISVASPCPIAASSSSPPLRILLQEIGSSLWSDAENDLKFVASLRALVSSSGAVALLLINSNAMSNVHRDRLYSYCDGVVRLEAFDDEAVVEGAERSDGALRVIRLPAVLSAGGARPEGSDLLFELRSSGLRVSVFHLPPAFAAHQQPDSQNTSFKCIASAELF